MRRGTTPTHVFTTDIDLTSAEVIYVTYQQNGRTILEFEKGDRLTVTPTDISVRLTQEETLAFDESAGVQIQIRVRFPDETAQACNIVKTGTEIILKEGVI